MWLKGKDPWRGIAEHSHMPRSNQDVQSADRTWLHKCKLFDKSALLKRTELSLCAINTRANYIAATGLWNRDQHDCISSLPPPQYITALPSFRFVHLTDMHDWYGCQFHITFIAVDFIGRASNYCILHQKMLENSSARYWIVKSNIIIEHISGYNILIYKIIVVNTVYQDLMCLCVKY